MGLGAIEAIKAAGQEARQGHQDHHRRRGQGRHDRAVEGKINFIVECNPLLGPQLMDLAEKVVAGEEVPERVVTEETTFTQEQATEVLPDREVLTDGPARRDGLAGLAPETVGGPGGPTCAVAPGTRRER